MKRIAIILGLAVLLPACDDGVPAGYRHAEYVECTNLVDHSVMKSDEQGWWMLDGRSGHYDSPNASLTPRPGDSCKIYEYNARIQ
jgi:hypothetical protein